MATGVVFIHGMWSQSCVWEHWLTAFHERGYACELVTLPGHDGEATDAQRVGLGFRECVDTAAQAAARFARPILVGHSMGGLIAQKLATRVDPTALVLINSAAPRALFPLRMSTVRGLSRHLLRWGLWNDVLRLSREEADYLLFSRLTGEPRERAHARRLSESGRLAYQLGFGPLGSRVHHVARDAIRCPMLALAGVEDRMVPIQVSRAVARWYGPKLDYREYDGAHWLLEEPGYRERIEEVLAFLAAAGLDEAPTEEGARA